MSTPSHTEIFKPKELVDNWLTPVGVLHWLSQGFISFVRCEVFAIEHSLLRIYCRLRDYTLPVVTQELCHLMAINLSELECTSITDTFSILM